MYLKHSSFKTGHIPRDQEPLVVSTEEDSIFKQCASGPAHLSAQPHTGISANGHEEQKQHSDTFSNS